MHKVLCFRHTGRGLNSLSDEQPAGQVGAHSGKSCITILVRQGPAQKKVEKLRTAKVLRNCCNVLGNLVRVMRQSQLNIAVATKVKVRHERCRRTWSRKVSLLLSMIRPTWRVLGEELTGRRSTSMALHPSRINIR